MSEVEKPTASLGRIGRYDIRRKLGEGGMGAVFLARQTDLARDVVVKVITGEESPVALERFQREAVAIGKVSSDHVVKVYEFGIHGGRPFIAMELVDGASLDNVLVARRALPYAEATRIALEVARGLEAAHAVGVLHRDVKPANVLVGRDGRAKVTDFGLAKIAAAGALTQPGIVMGSPAYMPPEQAEGGTLDARADVYALGVTFYELLTGRLPFEGTSLAQLFRNKLEGNFVPLRSVVPHLPREVEDVCARLMACKPEDRPESMTEVVRLLEHVLGKTTDRPPTTRLSPLLAASAGGPTPNPATAETRAAPSSLAETIGGFVAEDRATKDVALTVPGRFGRFGIERLLGEGGMGFVYAARELLLDRPCVVKIVKPELARNADLVERFRREANAAAKISSEFVVKVYDFGVEREIPFISMELVEGTSVDALVQQSGHLSPLDATRIALGAAHGLAAAHDLGVLHRDVKPANLLVARTGRVKVADFGLAKDLKDAPLTAKGAVIGTPAYMSPEQMEGETLDGRADVYALGATYYELLTGRVPFPGKTVPNVLVSRAKPLTPPRTLVPEIPEAAERTCLALMTEDREHRPDMPAAVALLEDLLARLEGRAPASGEKKGRGPFLIVVVLVVLAAAVVAVALTIGGL